jgi:transcriptional regulator with XRE-family HTH domain
LIRNLRRSRRQAHNGRAWSQDDLALAVGTDTSHVSRIERGTVVPSRATLERIAGALELTTAQHDLLARFAGYAPETQLPTEAEIVQAVTAIDRLVRGYAHPVSLITFDLRLVYANPLYLRSRRVAPALFDRHLRGRTIPELSLAVRQDSVRGGDTAARAESARRWTRFLRLVWDTYGGEQLSSAVRALMRDESFRAWWQEAAVDLVNGLDLPSEYFSWTLQSPEFGPLRFDQWWSRHPADRRFIVRHDVPADPLTQRAMAVLALERAGEPA